MTFSMYKQTKKSSVTYFYALLFSRWKSPKIKEFEILKDKKNKFWTEIIIYLYSILKHYAHIFFSKFQRHIFIVLFLMRFWSLSETPYGDLNVQW